MKRILLLITAIASISGFYSQNINYTVEIDFYGTTVPSDGVGFEEEPTWKCWGQDNGNVPNYIGGVCESDDGNTPFTYPATSVVLINETNTPATFLTIRLDGWEDDDGNFSDNAPGSVDRCSYSSSDGDDDYETVISQIDITGSTGVPKDQCVWKTYTIATANYYRVSLRVKWEYTDFTAQTPISGCDNNAQLSAFGSGIWSLAPGNTGAGFLGFALDTDSTTTALGVVGETYQILWESLPDCMTPHSESVTLNMLPNPVPGLTTSSNLCENEDLIFTASNGVNYDWATGTVGNVVSTTANGLDTIFNVTIADLPVFVTVTDANGCTASESWSAALTAGPVVDVGNDTTICSGTTATLDAWNPTPYAYLWNNGETTSIINPSSAAEYIVAVTDFASGCAGYDTVNVSLYPPSLLFLGYDVQFCIGDTVILDAQPGFTSYQWSDGSSNQIDTIVGFGEISVTIIDTNTCVLQDTINFSPVYTYFSLYSDTTIFLGNSISLNGPDGVSHLWNNGLTTQDITMSPIEDTTYIVTALQANGCYDVADVNVLINEELNFFIPNLFTPNNDESNDFFLMYGNGINEDNFNFTIYNRWGEIVFETTDVNKMLTEGWDGTSNEQQQPVGTYVWVMTGFQDDNDNTPLQFAGKNTGTILLKR
jgi:gliding motility-associated-like protein